MKEGARKMIFGVEADKDREARRGGFQNREEERGVGDREKWLCHFPIRSEKSTSRNKEPDGNLTLSDKQSYRELCSDFPPSVPLINICQKCSLKR